MKLTIAIITCILLVGCPKDKTPSKTTQKETVKEQEKIDACQQTTIASIANIMGWKASEVKDEQTFSFKKYKFSACTYRKNNTSESATLKIYHKSDKAAENKVLENQFSSFLTNGNQGYAYKEIEGSSSQTILGTYSNRGLHFYHLRSRFQNKYEFSSEICTANKNEELAEKQLKQLVALLKK